MNILERIKQESDAKSLIKLLEEVVSYDDVEVEKLLEEALK